MTGTNGWAEHKKLVEYRLEHNEAKIESMDAKLDEIQKAIVTLKTKSSLWGAIGGALPAIAAIAYMLLQ